MYDQDYYPFGMEMPGRSYSLVGEDYRFGFNGKEADKNGEWGGLTHYDYGFRIFNPGIGRFLSVDPLARQYSGVSPYAFTLNTPIQAVDPDGQKTFFLAGGSYKGNNQFNPFTGAFVKSMRDILGDKFQVINSAHTGLVGNLIKGRKYGFKPLQKPMKDKRVATVVNEITAEMAKMPEGEPLNIVGASYGGMLGAQVAVELAEKGTYVDNIIISRSAMSKESDIYQKLQQLQEDGLIGRVLYDDEAYNDPNDGTVGLLGKHKFGSTLKYLGAYFTKKGRVHAENAKKPEQGVKMTRQALIEDNIEGDEIKAKAQQELKVNNDSDEQNK
ncbi:MAG: RHS repeat-associated core domain-containing protein [Bacteroidota bacterium]